MDHDGSAISGSSPLNEFPLFSSLPESEIEVLSQALKSRRFQAGEVLLREDERGDCYFVVLEGEVEIIKTHGTSDERLIGLEGRYLGDMSPFAADCRRTLGVA